jgi:hypothetical protein
VSAAGILLDCGWGRAPQPGGDIHITIPQNVEALLCR